MTCTHCSEALVPSEGNLDPNTPPWTCVNCNHSWWMSELHDSYIALWRPEYHDWGYETVDLTIQIEKEHHDALVRGASILYEQLLFVRKETLQALLTLELDEDYRSHVETELAGRV